MNQHLRSTALALLVATAAAAPAVALTAGPASAAPRFRVQLDSVTATHVIEPDGSVTVTGTFVGDPFEGTFTGTLAAVDGSLPDPGECEPAVATLSVEGRRGRFLDLESSGNVCGEWPDPPHWAVTQSYTGRYVISDSS